MSGTEAVPRMRSVGRALGVLEQVADAGVPLGLSELAGACGLPMSTAHRVVHSLVASGYLHREPDRRYRLGPRLVALGGVAFEPVGPEVSAWLRRLVVATGETANAATLCSDQVMFVAQADSPHQLRASVQMHHRTMAHCSGLGKALLSLLPDGEVVALAARTGLPRRTDRTITSIAALLDALRGVREAGHGVDDEEEETGVRCVAVPVAAAPFPLAVSVSGPSGRLTHDRVPAIAEELRRVVAAT